MANKKPKHPECPHCEYRGEITSAPGGEGAVYRCHGSRHVGQLKPETKHQIHRINAEGPLVSVVWKGTDIMTYPRDGIMRYFDRIHPSWQDAARLTALGGKWAKLRARVAAWRKKHNDTP